MAQFIPTVPGIGAAFGSGFNTGLQRIADLKIDQLLKQQQNQDFNDALSALAKQGQPQQEQQVTPEGQLQAGQVPTQAAPGQQVAQQAQPQVSNFAPFIKALSQSKNLSPQQIQTLLGIQQAQEQQQEKRSTQQRKEEHESQKEINARTQKYYDEVIAKGDAARFAEKRLNKMKSLIEKGGLPFSALYNIINSLEDVSPSSGGTSGGIIGGLAGGVPGAAIGAAIGGLVSPVASILRGIQRFTSPNSEEFEKLSADFIRDAKGIFGSRITDADLKAFLKTVPTLAQTDQGKLKIINNLEAFNKASLAEEKALKEILKEHKGKRPDNLQFLVKERTEKKLSEYANEFEA